MSEKQDLIKKLLEMQKKFIDYEHQNGVEMEDYFIAEEGHPLYHFRQEYMDLANQLTGVTMHEPGVSRLVAVDVDEAVQLAVAVAADDDRLAADVGGEMIVRVGHLAFVAQVDPGALEDVFHLQFEQFLVGEQPAVDLEQAVLRTVDEQAVEFCGGHGFRLLWRAAGRFCG